MSKKLESVVTIELGRIGFELVELRREGTKTRPIVEIRIDRRDGDSVTIEDCSTVSRILEPVLEASGLVPRNYVLQVSSPGERALRAPADWRRIEGRWVSGVSLEHGGPFEEMLVAIEGDEGSEVAVLKSRKGVIRRIPLATVKDARLAFHW